MVASNEKQLQDIDNSFNALLIVVSVVQVGIVASILAVPFLGVIPSTPVLLQNVSKNIVRSIFDAIIPIIALSVCWWGGSFFESPALRYLLKLISWFLLFSQVVYSLNVLLTLFNFSNRGVILQVTGLSPPFVSLVFLYFIRQRYERLTGIRVKTRYLGVGCALFILYWIGSAFISTTPIIVTG